MSQKYRLIPDAKGTYTLEKWYYDIKMYLAIGVRLTPEKADRVIKNLERDTIYYRESTQEDN